jgi:glycosyltransferase involved in cell wall biosynthesis
MKIGLGMIVRNEEKDIEACLESFLPHIDYAVIVDTGSTDHTLDIVKEIAHRHPCSTSFYSYEDASDSEGRMMNFSQARNRYVEILEQLGVDYILSVDADDTIDSPIKIRKLIADKKADVYSIDYRMNANFSFKSYKLWKARLGIRYTGRVHEVIQFDWSSHKVEELPVEILHHGGTHEGQECGTERNMRILKAEIYPPLRSLFYWANENVDSKNYDEAIKWYLEYIRRCKAGESAWPVELAHCYWRAARWLQYHGRTDEAFALSVELIEKDPSWSEALCELAYISQLKGKWSDMKKFALAAKSNQYENRLFSEIDKYTTTPEYLYNLAIALEMSANGSSQEIGIEPSQD